MKSAPLDYAIKTIGWKCAGCGKVSGDGFKPCGCPTGVAYIDGVGTEWWPKRPFRAPKLALASLLLVVALIAIGLLVYAARALA